MREGATYDQVIATLAHCISLVEGNRAAGRVFEPAPVEPLTAENTGAFLTAVEAARDAALAADRHALTTSCTCPSCGRTVDIRILPRRRVRAVCRTLDCLSILQ